MPAGTTNLRLSIEGEDIERFGPSLEWNTSGPPELYLEVALREATAAKGGKNRLAESANNIVAINIPSEDFQSSLGRQMELGLPIPEPTLPSDVHQATVSTCGIDQPTAGFHLGCTSLRSHPGLGIFVLSANGPPRQP